MKRCPYCAAELKPGATRCNKCDKTFGDESKAKPRGYATRDAYEKRIIPTWVFVLVVALGLLCLVLIFVV